MARPMVTRMLGSTALLRLTRMLQMRMMLLVRMLRMRLVGMLAVRMLLMVRRTVVANRVVARTARFVVVVTCHALRGAPHPT
jgi:hypothetical protein